MQLETKAGSVLDRTQLARDVRRLWATGWFEGIHVEANKTLGGVELAFEVVEKPRLHLRGVEFQPAAGRYPVRPKAGTLIDAQLARGLAETLRQQLVEDGYADARVTAKLVPVRPQEADLLIQVNAGPPCRVEKVRLSGTLRMKQKEVRGVLRSTRIRRLLPGIPGLWNGWQLRPILARKEWRLTYSGCGLCISPTGVSMLRCHLPDCGSTKTTQRSISQLRQAPIIRYEV